MRNIGEEIIFKPRYSAGHWWRLFEPLVFTVPPLIIFLAEESARMKYAAMADMPYDGLRIPITVLFSIIGVFTVLRILSFLAGQHIRKIEVSNTGIVVHRVIGVRIAAYYIDFEWKGNMLTLSKHHNFDLTRTANRDTLKELLQKYMQIAPEVPEEEPDEEPVDDKKKTSIREVFGFLLFFTIFAAAIVGLILLPELLKDVFLSDPTVWAIDGVLACGICIYLFTIIRKTIRA